MKIFTLPNGKQFGTGLQLPSVRPMTMSAFADEVPVWTAEQIREVVTDTSWTSAREIFPAAQYQTDQGTSSACNGFAATKALTKARVLRGLPFEKLSGYSLYAQINGGRDQGSMLDDGMHAIMNTGCAPESMILRGALYMSQIPGTARNEFVNFRAEKCYRCDAELELATALAMRFMCVVATHVGDSWYRLNSDGVAGATRGVGNHAVQVDDVRWRNNQFQFDHDGSWGLSYGQQGRAWLTWSGHLSEPNKYHAFYCIPTTVDGKQAAA